MRDTLLFILLGLFLGVLGCSRPTEAQCDRAFDHYFKVKMRGVPDVIKKVDAIKFESRRAEFLNKCVSNVETPVIRCWLNAETLAEIEACQKTDSIL